MKVMRLCVCLFLLFGSFNSALVHASSQIVVNQAVVVLEDRSEMRDSLREALQQVFVKTSGNNEVLDDPAIKRSVRNYEQYLISSRTEQRGDTLYLEATFNKEKIITLLDSLQLPVWSDLRPSAIVWLGYRDENSFEYTSEVNLQPFAEIVNSAAQRRGVELLLPVGDIEDNQVVNGYDAWSQNVSKLLQQSFRYPSENFISLSVSKMTPTEIEFENNQRLEEYQLRLISEQQTTADDLTDQTLQDENLIEGAIFQESSDELQPEALSQNMLDNESIPPPEMLAPDIELRIDYVIVTPDDTKTGQFYGNDPVELIDLAIDQYANELSRRFAVVSAPQQAAEVVAIAFRNINSLKSLEEVRGLLSRNPMVRSVVLKKQQGTLSMFEVEIIDEATKLVEILTIDQRVEYISTSENESEQLDFSWIGR